MVSKTAAIFPKLWKCPGHSWHRNVSLGQWCDVCNVLMQHSCDVANQPAFLWVQHLVFFAWCWQTGPHPKCKTMNWACALLFSLSIALFKVSGKLSVSLGPVWIASHPINIEPGGSPKICGHEGPPNIKSWHGEILKFISTVELFMLFNQGFNYQCNELLKWRVWNEGWVEQDGSGELAEITALTSKLREMSSCTCVHQISRGILSVLQQNWTQSFSIVSFWKADNLIPTIFELEVSLHCENDSTSTGCSCPAGEWGDRVICNRRAACTVYF